MDIGTTRGEGGGGATLGGGPEAASASFGPGRGLDAGLDTGGPDLGGFTAGPGQGLDLGFGSPRGPQMQMEAGA